MLATVAELDSIGDLAGRLATISRGERAWRRPRIESQLSPCSLSLRKGATIGIRSLGAGEKILSDRLTNRAKTQFDQVKATASDVRSTLWFFPAIETIGLAILAIVLILADQALYNSGQLGGRDDVFRGGVDGARGVLTAIAGSLIAAAATVFSITVVVFQLASSQFTPRVLPNFVADRRFQITVGTLLGTFVYCLLALWSVGHEQDDRQPFIPVLTIAAAILLALVSVALLILFIHHVSTLIQVSSLIDRVTTETIQRIGKYAADSTDEDERIDSMDLESDGVIVVSDSAGYLRSMNMRELLDAAEARGATIEMLCSIGTFMIPGLPIARVVPVTAIDEELMQKIRGACQLHSERMSGNDIEVGYKLIADIA
ncbi:MAG: DUF2254 domain-containing protein, partial [Thermomicrobiales bacterium]